MSVAGIIQKAIADAFPPPEAWGDPARMAKAHPEVVRMAKSRGIEIRKVIEPSPTAPIERIEKVHAATNTATDEFMAKVAEIQGDNPRLSYQQAYTAAYTDRANAPIVKRMKAEAPERGVRKQLPEPQMTGPQIAMAAKAIERERAEPNLTPEQAYAKAYTDPANRDVVKRLKAEQRA